MATFRKRGSRWQAQIRRRGQAAISKTFDTKREAEAWARQAEVELEREDASRIMPVTVAATLKDALEKYSKEVTPTKRGASPEKYRIGKMMRQKLSRKQLKNINIRDIADYRDQRLRHVSNDSVRKELQILRQVFELARTEWGFGVRENPVIELRLPPPGAPRVRRVTVTEAHALALALRSTRSVVVKHVVRFAVLTGMRRSEILNIMWKHIDWTNSTVIIPKSKNGHSRIVPLCDQALKLLKQIQSKKLDVRRVFPISENAVRLGWQRLRERSGIQDLRFHDLRHEAISSFFEQGLSLPEVALISGHRDPRQLMRYTHMDAIKVAKKLRTGAKNAVAL